MIFCIFLSSFKTIFIQLIFLTNAVAFKSAYVYISVNSNLYFLHARIAINTFTFIKDNERKFSFYSRKKKTRENQWPLPQTKWSSPTVLTNSLIGIDITQTNTTLSKHHLKHQIGKELRRKKWVKFVMKILGKGKGVRKADLPMTIAASCVCLETQHPLMRTIGVLSWWAAQLVYAQTGHTPDTAITTLIILTLAQTPQP